MDNLQAAEQLTATAEKIGIVAVMSQFGNNLHVSIPMNRIQWATSITELNLSVRSYNGLRRAGVETIGELSRLIMTEQGVSTVRNLGRKSISEIKTALLIYGYNDYTHDEKIAFWLKFLDN